MHTTPRRPRRAAAAPSSASPASSAPSASPAFSPSAAFSSPGRGTHGLLQDGRWLCDCTPRRPAVLRETHKPGPNQGRWFYTCAQADRRRQCRFFLWEDYAGGGAGEGQGQRGGRTGRTGRTGSSRSGTTPRSTYRTSMGRRTTPEAERDPRPGATTTTPSGRGGGLTARGVRQRLFGTPRRVAGEAPATWTATPTRPNRSIRDFFRPPAGEEVAAPASASASTSTSALAPPPPPAPPIPSSSAARPPSPSYSDASFDSDMDRALVALADHSERESLLAQGRVGQAQQAQQAQQDRSDSRPTMPVQAPEAMALDGDVAAAPAVPRDTPRTRGIIVPTAAPPLAAAPPPPPPPPPHTPTSRLRRGRNLLLARGDPLGASFASTATNATDATDATDATTVTTPPSSIRRKRHASGDGYDGYDAPSPLGSDDDNDDAAVFSPTPPVSTKKRRTATGAVRYTPVAAAVLGLLADQPVDARVRQQLQELLNSQLAAE